MERYGYEFDDEWNPLQVELWCLANLPRGEQHGHLRMAMMMLWPQLYEGEAAPGVAKWREELELLSWAWCNYRLVAVIGHASAGKTHTMAHIGFTYYLASAHDTILTLTSTHLPGLKKRIWSDVVAAAKQSILGDCCYIRPHDLTIRPLQNQKEDKYVVEGVAVGRDPDAVTRIQGNHSKNHRHVIIDEAEGTPPAIFEALANLMTDQDFRCAMLANPENQYGEFGSFCEPVEGWDAIDAEQDQWWETARGGICIRLDGLRSPNMRFPKADNGKEPFPFLIDEGYVEQIKVSHGYESPRWWIFVRGWFPPAGTMGTVFNANVLGLARDRIQYNFPPTLCASMDPAFEGGDECILQFGEYGEANGSPFAFNFLGEQVVKVKAKPGGDPLDYLIAYEVMGQCKAKGILPEQFILDTTGAGRSIAAILDKEWGLVQRCEFGGAATDRKLKPTELKTCKDLFDRFVTELWFAAKAFMEENLVGGIGIAFKTLREQLTARKYEIKGGKESIETKKEMKKRLGYSPDHADAFVLFTELIRRQGAVAGDAAARPRNSRKEWKRAWAYSEAGNDEEFAHGWG